ncbi:MAG: DUF58 domain-containing protein [Lachnospiraceae bacterium]|nr:DUF58 domain-containing protein [Lachnospiraceae bacterium]
MRRIELSVYIALLILALVGISFYGGPITYTFFWLTILLPVACLIYIFYVIASIKIYQKSDGRGMVCGVPSDFYITVNNESIFSFSSLKIVFYSSFSTVTGLNDKIEYELPPHSSVTRKTRLVCRYRGEYLVGIKEIEVRDFIGLFRVIYRIREPLSVIVAPAMVKLTELGFMENIEDSDRDSLALRTEPDIPVREYATGDDMRLINYKATASMQKLMVRELIGGEKNGVALFMEAGRYSHATEDYLPVENTMIECTLALALYYTENNIPVDVIYRTNCTIKEPVRNHVDYDRLYEAMRIYSFREEDDTDRMLEEAAALKYITDHRMLIFILYRYGIKEADLIDKINIGQVPVRVFVVGEDPENAVNAGTGKNTFVSYIGTASAEEVL